MKQLLLVVGVLLFTGSAFGQSTTLTATATDSGGQVWANGTYRITFYNAGLPGPYYWNGSQLPPGTTFSGPLDSTGSFTQAGIPSSNFINPVGTQWSIQVCPAATSPCFLENVSIQGSTQTVALTPPPALVPAASYNQPTAYTDAEIGGPVWGFLYWNVLSNTLRACEGPVPCTWVNVGGGGGGGTVTGTGTLNTITKWCGASVICNASGFDDNINPEQQPNGMSVMGNALFIQKGNSNPGTTANSLVKLTSSGNATILATTDTVSVGIAGQGAGNAGNVQIAFAGDFPCTFDNQTTIGDFVIISTTVGGDCHDSATAPAGVNNPPVVASLNAGTGTTAVVDLLSPITPAVAGGAGCTLGGITNGNLLYNNSGVCAGATPFTYTNSSVVGSGLQIFSATTNATALLTWADSGALASQMSVGVITGLPNVSMSATVAGASLSASLVPQEVLVSNNTSGEEAILQNTALTFGNPSIQASYGSTLMKSPSMQDTGITGSTQCIQADTTGLFSGTGAPCGGGGGSGTVTSFSAGNLSPLFTSAVATATTTPALTFTLSNAGANTVFGNSTGGSAAPSFTSITTAMLPFTYTTTNSSTLLLTGSGSFTNGHCVAVGANGNMVDNGSACGTGGGGGTVTSVGLSLPASLFTLSGTPVTTTGTLTGTFATIAAHSYLGNSTGSSAAASITTLSSGDIPNNAANTSGSAASLSATLACGVFPALTGDVTTTAGSCVTTNPKVNGVAYPTSPTTNTVPVVTGSNTVTYELLPVAALASSSTTINTVSCTLGGSCTIPVGTGTISGSATTNSIPIMTSTTSIGTGPLSVASSILTSTDAFVAPSLTSNGAGAGSLNMSTTVVASLPAASSNSHTLMMVSDSTTIATPGQTCAGGGTQTALAFSDGSVWHCSL